MYQMKPGMSTAGKQLRQAARLNPLFWRRSGGFWRRRSDLRHVAHLPARPRRTLAVKVEGRARDGQPLLIAVDLVHDQIGHGDRAMTDRLAERAARTEEEPAELPLRD